ncbi:14898_t:CDS:1, partial [Cetraspora pellucida]
SDIFRVQAWGFFSSIVIDIFWVSCFGIADIYGFGVIITEITSCKRPFDGCNFNTKLASDIFGTSKCYVELAKKYMDSVFASDTLQSLANKICRY